MILQWMCGEETFNKLYKYSNITKRLLRAIGVPASSSVTRRAAIHKSRDHKPFVSDDRYSFISDDR